MSGKDLCSRRYGWTLESSVSDGEKPRQLWWAGAGAGSQNILGGVQSVYNAVACTFKNLLQSGLRKLDSGALTHVWCRGVRGRAQMSPWRAGCPLRGTVGCRLHGQMPTASTSGTHRKQGSPYSGGVLFKVKE